MGGRFLIGGGTGVLGLVEWQRRGALPAEQVCCCGMRCCVVRVLPGGSLRAKRSRLLAVRTLRQAHVAHALFAPDFTEQAYFAAHGIAPVAVLPLRAAKAPELIRLALAARAIPPSAASVTLAGEYLTAGIEAAALALAPDVRYLSLAVPHGAEALRERLRRTYGIASVPGCRDGLTADFTREACGAELPLASGALLVTYALPSEAEAERWGNEPLAAALYLAGVLPASRLPIRSAERSETT